MSFTLCFPPIADREVQQILLELLNHMDGFDQSMNVKVWKYMYLVNVYNVHVSVNCMKSFIELSDALEA